MPKLPTAEDLGGRPVPQVRGGIQPLNLQTPRLGAEAQALTEFGDAVKGMGDVLNTIAINEKKKLDPIRARGALNDYLDGQLELESGKDGFLNRKGGDAVTGDLNKTYRTKREELRKKYRDSLDNDEQRQIFDQHADVADRQYDGRLYTHLSQQTQIYKGVVYEGTLLSERKMAVANRDQPGAIRLSLLNIDKAIEEKARQEGLSYDREQDRTVIDTMKVMAHTQVHSDVVDAMLASGQDKAALVYYNRIKGELSSDAIAVLGSKVQAASTDGAAMRAADVAWDTHGPGPNLNAPVRLDLMDDAIRRELKDDPRARDAAIREIHARAAAHNDAQREMTAANGAAVMQAYNDGKSLVQIQRLPEFQALDGGEKEKFIRYIQDSGYSEESKARARAAWAEGELDKRGARKYWDLSDPKVLAGMSEKQIWAMEPEIGPNWTQKLIVQRRSLESPAKVLAATVDSDLFNQAAHKAGLDPYTKNMSADKKAALGQLKNHIEGIIDLEQRGGRELNRTQKEEIVQKEMDRKVWLDNWSPGTYNLEMPAAAVLPKQRADIRVKIEDIQAKDPKWLKEAANYMRSADPKVNWRLPDADLFVLYKDRFERAYAVSQTGGTAEEGNKILTRTE